MSTEMEGCFESFNNFDKASLKCLPTLYLGFCLFSAFGMLILFVNIVLPLKNVKCITLLGLWGWKLLRFLEMETFYRSRLVYQSQSEVNCGAKSAGTADRISIFRDAPNSATLRSVGFRSFRVTSQLMGSTSLIIFVKVTQLEIRVQCSFECSLEPVSKNGCKHWWHPFCYNYLWKALSINVLLGNDTRRLYCNEMLSCNDCVFVHTRSTI